MRAMQCELCGGTDIVKEDDFFVCQSCGMKYTPENAKKMMIDGVVNIQGTVKLDNTKLIDNYLSISRNAYDSGNSKEAEEYANKVLEIDPTNYKALYLKGVAAGWQTSGMNNRIPEAVDCFALAIENCADEQKLEDLKETVANDVSKLTLAMMRLRCEIYKKLPSEENAISLFAEAKNSLDLVLKLIASCGFKPKEFRGEAATMMNNAAVDAFDGVIWKDYTNGKPLILTNKFGVSKYKLAQPNDVSRYATPSKYDFDKLLARTDACIKIIEAAISIDPNDDEEDLTRYKNLISITEEIRDTYSVTYNPGDLYVSAKWFKEYELTDKAKEARDNQIKNWKSKKEETERRIHQKKVDDYWGAHEEERKDIEERIKSLEKEVSDFTSSADYKECNEAVCNFILEEADLLKKLDQCGFFAKGKIKAQIKEARSKAKPTMDKLTALDKRIEPKRAEIKGLKEKLANPIQ